MDEYGWDDSDIDVDDQPPVVRTQKQGKTTHTAPSVQDYMAIMDKELSQTKVGKSFEKVTPKSSTSSATKVFRGYYVSVLQKLTGYRRIPCQEWVSPRGVSRAVKRTFLTGDSPIPCQFL